VQDAAFSSRACCPAAGQSAGMHQRSVLARGRRPSVADWSAWPRQLLQKSCGCSSCSPRSRGYDRHVRSVPAVAALQHIIACGCMFPVRLHRAQCPVIPTALWQFRVVLQAFNWCSGLVQWIGAVALLQGRSFSSVSCCQGLAPDGTSHTMWQPECCSRRCAARTCYDSVPPAG
jgi:hypothetical protein